jgi:hypothetical protein
MQLMQIILHGTLAYDSGVKTGQESGKKYRRLIVAKEIGSIPVVLFGVKAEMLNGGAQIDPGGKVIVQGVYRKAQTLAGDEQTEIHIFNDKGSVHIK